MDGASGTTTPDTDRIQSIALRAKALIGAVLWAAVATTASAFVLWFLLFAPFSFAYWWTFGLSILVLLGLSAPGAVLFLFCFGLKQLQLMPTRATDMAQLGRERGGEAVSATVRAPERGWKWGWRMLKAIGGLWSLVMESKDLVLRYALLAKLANPVTLIVVLMATVAAILLTLITSVTVLGTLLL